MTIIMHSAKGSTWKQHKYLKKVGARYIYAGKVMVKSLEKGVENIAGSYDRAKEEVKDSTKEYKEANTQYRKDRDTLKHQTAKAEYNRKRSTKKNSKALKTGSRKDLNSAKRQEKRKDVQTQKQKNLENKVKKDKKKLDKSKERMDKAIKKLNNHPITRIKKFFT